MNLRSRLLVGIASAALVITPARAQVVIGGGSGSGSGSVTSVATGACLTGGPITTTGTVSGTYTQRSTSGTTDTVLSSDACKIVTYNNASPVAVTLPQATGSFGAGFSFDVENLGAGLVTITPTTSTINGSSTLTVATKTSCTIWSDGTNWQVFACTAISSGGSPGGSNTQLQYNNSGAFGGITGATWNGSTLTLPGFTSTGNIDLSGAASRDILMNATSEIYVGGSSRIAFFSGYTFFNGTGLASGNTSGPVFPNIAATGTAPTLIPNQASQTTGWGAQASGNMSGIVGGVEKIRLTAEGVQYKQATPPAVGGTATPSIATGSTDESGEVTSGTSATSVTITFNLSHTNAPFCVVTAQPQIASFAYTISNTVITITMTATTGAKIDYRCTFP